MLSPKSVLSNPLEKFSFHLLRSGVRGQGQQEDTRPAPLRATKNAEDTSAQTGVLRSSRGYLSTLQTEISNIAVNQEENWGQRLSRGMAATDMRMSCALSRSLLLAELMKMPSSSVVELLDDKRLCRPTRPFQPRPGEALQTEAAPSLRTLTSHFTVAILPDVSLIHVSPAFCPN